MSLAAAAKHVQVLERAGLIHRRLDGPPANVPARARPARYRAGPARFLRRHWNESLDTLEGLFQAEPADEQGEQS